MKGAKINIQNFVNQETYDATCKSINKSFSDLNCTLRKKTREKLQLIIQSYFQKSGIFNMITMITCFRIEEFLQAIRIQQ